jgi:NADH dehydrogenase FAD-containing subunit
LPQLDAKAGQIAEDFLKTKNVEILYKTSYVDKLKKEKGYDLVLQCVGQTYKSDFMKKSFPKSIAKSGQIFVNDNFQVIGEDSKSNGKAKAVKENVFVFGDICKTSLNEVKNIPSIKFLAPFITQNIKDHLKGELPSNPIPAKLPIFAAVSIGPSYGMFVTNQNVNAGEGLAAGKFTFAEDWIKIIGGAHAIVKG